MTRIGSDTSTPTATATVLIFQRAPSTIGPLREFRVAVGVEQAPIGADATFGSFPWLVESLDDVVVHAERLGARQERADYTRLLELAGNGTLAIVAAARPAELRDDNALAGKCLFSQEVVDPHGLIERTRGRNVVPVRQDVLGVVRIIGIDFARRHRNAAVGFTLDALNYRYEILDFIPAICRRPFVPVLDLFAALDPVLDLVVLPDPPLDLFPGQILSTFLRCPSAPVGVTLDPILDLFQAQINPA
jgi:hypothetical protein